MRTISDVEALDAHRAGGAIRLEGAARLEIASVDAPLRVDGDLVAAVTLRVVGDLEVRGDLHAEGSLHVEGAVRVGGTLRADESLQVRGDLEAGGDLEVGGYGYAAGAVTVGGELRGAGGLQATELLRAGVVDLRGDLVAQAVRSEGDLRCGANLRSAGAIEAGGSVEVGGFLDARSIDAGGDVTLASNVYFSGTIEAKGAIVGRGDLSASSLLAGGDIEAEGDLAADRIVRFAGGPPPLSAIDGIVIWDEEALALAPAQLEGRELDRRRIAQVLSRATDPVLVLVADPGVGVTALLEGTARAALEGRLPPLEGRRFAALDVERVQRNLARGKNVGAEIAGLAGELARIDDVILVVDGLHYLSAGDWAVRELLEGLRPDVFSGRLPTVLTTTPGQLAGQLASDPLFGRRTERHHVRELSPERLRGVVDACVDRVAALHGVAFADEAIATALEQSLDPEHGYRPPAATLRLLDTAARVGSGAVEAADVVAAAPDRRKDGAVDREVLRHLEARVNKQVLGQDEAVAAAVRRIRLAKLGLDRRSERPDGVFLLLGPSGVGKTELAKAVTRALYGDLRRLVRLDMSEYMAEHEYSKAIGSPPGYIGHGEEGHLTGRVARLEHTVVLLDEIDKAHPSLLGLFLQVFDEGFLTDGKGQRVDFSHSVVMMTTNLGRELWDDQRMGFRTAVEPGEPDAARVREFLLQRLPAEFVNRVDVLVPFRALDRDDLAQILDKLVDEEERFWQRRGKALVFEPAAKELLVERGYEPRLGARHLERNLEREVVQRLGEAVFTERWDAVDRIVVDVEDGAIVLRLDR